MKHPTISAGLSLKDWNFYKQEWERYKTDSHDTDPARTVNQLLECLDVNLCDLHVALLYIVVKLRTSLLC